MCVCVCMCQCVYYICVCVCMCQGVYYVCVCVFVCVYVCVCEGVSRCVYVSECMHVYMYCMRYLTLLYKLCESAILIPHIHCIVVKSHPREISKRFGSLASCFARKHIQVQYSITSSQSTHKFDIKSFTSSSITSTTSTFIHEVQRLQPSTKTPTKERNGDK